MAELQNVHDPQWIMFPVNNDRTAWRPFGLPMLLIIPHRRDLLGNPVPNSGIDCIKVYVEDVPQWSEVAGHQHIIQTQPTDSCDQPLVTLTQYTDGIITQTEADTNNTSAIRWLQDNNFTLAPDGEHWISNTQQNIRYTITPVPPTYGQLRYPDRELYAVLVNSFQLADKWIPMTAVDYYDRTTDITSNVYPQPAIYTLIEGEPTYGHYFRYMTRSGVYDYLPYLPDADYYDFSDILIDVEPLPSGHYVLIYQCEYYTRERTTVGTGELLCINPNSQNLAIFRFPFNHPGEIIDEFYRLTPAPYITDTQKSVDTTIGLYRPFTDALQDIYDEQTLLRSINWIYNIPDQLIPYLATLLGWDFPYLPTDYEGLRRVLLLNTSWLQTVKGSRLAITEVFRLIGLEILINNLWWSSDGKVFITPGENPDWLYRDQKISIQAQDQIDPLLIDYTTSGVGGMTIPLLHRPQIVGGLDNFNAPQDGGDVYITSFLVDNDSAAHAILADLVHGDSAHVGAVADPAAWTLERQTKKVRYVQGVSHTYQDNFLTEALLEYVLDRNGDVQIRPKLADGQRLDGIGGCSQIRLVKNSQPNVASGPLGIAISQTTYTDWTLPPLIQSGVQFDRTNNTITLTFNGYIDFAGNSDLPGRWRDKVLFVFASYVRQQLIIPQVLTNLQSNRFDIQLLQVDSVPPLAGMYTHIDPKLLDFAIEFLQKIKAFHSLLNTVRLVLELTETYEVGDICVGGDIQQRYDTMMGTLQVPHAIIPKMPGEDCDQLDPLRLGYKRADIIYRLRKLANLPEEHAAWRRLNDRGTGFSDFIRITGAEPDPNRADCKFNIVGQDRVKAPTPMIIPSIRPTTESIESGPSPNAAQITTNSDAGPDISPNDVVLDGIFDDTGGAVSSNNDSSAYGSFTRQYDDRTVGEPLCDLDGVTDYCYKGRVHDELLHRAALVHAEIYRNRIFGPTLGNGVYWTYSAMAREFVAGTARPSRRSLTGKYWLTAASRQAYVNDYRTTHTTDGIRQSPYLDAPYDIPLQHIQDTFLGRLFQAYGNPKAQTIHYTNTIQPAEFCQTRALSLLRPTLEVGLEILHFPGCRFLTLMGLSDDYTHDTWMAKPWDDQYSSVCGPAGWCQPEPTWLNARLAIDHYGDELLVYDVAPCVIRGDGLVPDIPSLLGHGAAVATVVHSVYTTAGRGYIDLDSGQPAIVMDRVDYAPDAIVPVTGPLFDTYTECSDAYFQKSMVDFADGYPGSVGTVSHGVVIESQFGGDPRLFEAVPSTALYLLGDGVLVGSGIRLDAYNNRLRCDGTVITPCSSIGMYMDGGCVDPHEDKLEILSAVVFDEPFGGAAQLLNGSIPTLFELLPTCPSGVEILARLEGNNIRCFDPPVVTIGHDIGT